MHATAWINIKYPLELLKIVTLAEVCIAIIKYENSESPLSIYLSLLIMARDEDALSK